MCSPHSLRFLIWDALSNPLLNILIDFSTSRFSILFAHSIISSSVITSSSRVDYTIFLETILPTSVLLSKNGKSALSYKSKSMAVPHGCLSKDNLPTGNTVRAGKVSLLKAYFLLGCLTCFGWRPKVFSSSSVESSSALKRFVGKIVEVLNECGRFSLN